jgi:response regulator RpfG family c-di-GMP phosphodiesterase
VSTTYAPTSAGTHGSVGAPVAGTTVPPAIDKARILCVDDEQALLDGIARNLRPFFSISTALSGEAALALMASEPPFAVIVSDMRMPGMSGAEFLAEAHKRSPDSTRLLLTGQADLESTVAAVNEGQIFRFLSKPCSVLSLRAAISTGVAQHRLVTAERELLEQTLRGSVQALLDVLALASPKVFARATLLRRRISACERSFANGGWWEVEVAAMLSQVGAVTLPPEVIDKLHDGTPLTRDELAMVEQLPAIADELLAKIPRLEAVREIIRRQDEPFAAGGANIPLGARLLRVVRDYDALEVGGLTPAEAIGEMRGRTGSYDPEVLETFARLAGVESETTRVVEQLVAKLRPGMVFAEDLLGSNGGLLATRGHQVTPGLIRRLANMRQSGWLAWEARVTVIIDPEFVEPDPEDEE